MNSRKLNINLMKRVAFKKIVNIGDINVQTRNHEFSRFFFFFFFFVKFSCGSTCVFEVADVEAVLC